MTQKLTDLFTAGCERIINKSYEDKVKKL